MYDLVIFTSVFFFFFLQTVAWLVAGLVILINGYLLLDFYTEEVRGVLFGSVACAFTVAYITFVAYLVLRGISVSNVLRSLQPKWFSSSANWPINLSPCLHIATRVILKSFTLLSSPIILWSSFVSKPFYFPPEVQFLLFRVKGFNHNLPSFGEKMK